MHAPIWLKFGTRIGGLKANTRNNFGVNLINNEGVIGDFTHKAESNFCHTYKITTLRNKLKISM